MRDGPTGPGESSQQVSAGTISVATCPGAPYEAATASAVSRASVSGDSTLRTHEDTPLAIDAMSDWSGASYLAWYVAWSPTTLTIGTSARRALCRLARPLPRPGPRWRSTAAGLSAMRAYPSAAPVATPSKSASTPRISGTASRACTKCISEVPGFMKQTSTPESTRVRIIACAPFIFCEPFGS